ncbi:MAG: tRNA (adenosine(37)-N6)-threonylcarbamoyltransferase complex ATPase subunit type 1 TsaE [Saprospiraceae bacterium]|nr:tRNA (adenosine(37)-N6)-threonylcarbamoyltransferase complex ATPase subunit type 1 TsaE [Saprospiraceae bacterium]
MQQQIIANSIADLDLIADQIVPIIHSRKKVAFVGEIGAGKTTFIKLLCYKLGIKDITSSPTFSIINEYATSNTIIHHIDLFRLNSKEEVFSLGIMELFDGINYCFVEWPDLIEDYFPEQTIWIKITAKQTGQRIFDIYYQ